VGDKVRVLGDVKKVSELQKGHGDWSHNTALVGSLDGVALWLCLGMYNNCTCEFGQIALLVQWNLTYPNL